MKISRPFLVLSTIVCLSCNNRPEDRFDKIYEELQIASLKTLYKTESEVVVPYPYYMAGDTLDFITNEFSPYIIDRKNPRKGEMKKLDTSAILIYSHRIPLDSSFYTFNRHLFKIYDSLGNYIDTGWFFEDTFLRAIHGDYMDIIRKNFYQELFRNQDESFRAIENKYSISRRQIDSLVWSRVGNLREWHFHDH